MKWAIDYALHEWLVIGLLWLRCHTSPVFLSHNLHQTGYGSGFQWFNLGLCRMAIIKLVN